MQEGIEAFVPPTARGDIAQLRSEVGTLAKQGMATDAVVLLPDQLAAHHGLGHRILIGPLGQGSLGMESQGQEQQDEEQASPEVDVPGHAFGKCLGHGAS
ncbi:hypothetical protein D3C80_1530180 [compost metagenome]